MSIPRNDPANRRRRSSDRARVLAACAAAALALAGCSSSGAALSVAPSVPSGPPLPSGASILPPAATPAPPQPECDATTSLRPITPDEVSPNGTVAAIKARGHLIVGVGQNSNLFSFRDPLTGKLEGFDIDIAREVARDLFGDPDKVQFTLLTSAGREEALENRTVDVVVKTMSITCDRAQHVSFSVPYLDAHQRILTTKASGIATVADLGGRRVCIASGTTSLPTIRRLAPRATVLTVPNWGDCLVAIQQREVDAISTDDAVLAGLAVQNPNLVIVGPNLHDEPYGIGVHKGDDELVRFVNGTLARIERDGTWMRLYHRWLSVLGPTSGPPVPHYSG